jgi:hypothetical protein
VPRRGKMRKPRATPWVTHHEVTSPERAKPLIGKWSIPTATRYPASNAINSMHRANHCCAPSGLEPYRAHQPRALPWAITLGPFGAEQEERRLAEFAVQGQAIRANLRGLGYGG